MTDFFNLAPEGIGSLEVESFPSYFHRLAHLHSSTPLSLSEALSRWWRHRTSTSIGLPTNRLYDGKGLPLCGYGDAVGRYVGIVGCATGRDDLAKTTLLALHGVSDRNCHGALKRGRTWCPACMFESIRDRRPLYDRLVWSMLAVKRCPIHSVVLQSDCPHCGSGQRFYSSRGGQDHCFRCQHSLLRPPSKWQVDHQPGFGEADCCTLVSAVSRGEFTQCEPRAFKVFCDEIVAMIVPALGRHRGLPWGPQEDPRYWKLRGPPTLETMIRRCHVLGVSLLDVLIDPISAAHAAGELEFLSSAAPFRSRPRRPADLKNSIRAELTELLALPSEQRVPCFAEICRKHAVSSGYVRHRMGGLLSQYNQRVRLQNLALNRSSRARVAEWLRSAEYPKLFIELGQCEKRLVEYVRRRFEVSVPVARSAFSSFKRERKYALRGSDKKTRGRQRSPGRPRITAQRRAILSGLVAEPLTLSDIAKKVDSSSGSARQVLRKLEDDRYVDVVGKVGRKLIYSLTERGAAAMRVNSTNISLPASNRADLTRGRYPRLISVPTEREMLRVLTEFMADIRRSEDLAKALGRPLYWLAPSFRNSYGIGCGTWVLACKLSRVDWLIRRGARIEDAAITVRLDMRTVEMFLSGPLRFKGETVTSWRLACPASQPDSEWTPALPIRNLGI